MQTSPELRCSGPACTDVVAQPCKGLPQASSVTWAPAHSAACKLQGHAVRPSISCCCDAAWWQVPRHEQQRCRWWLALFCVCGRGASLPPACRGYCPRITACCLLQRWNIRTCSSALFCCQMLNEFRIMPTGSRRAAAAKLLRSPAPEQRAADRRAGPPAAGAGPALCRRPRSVGRLCAVSGWRTHPKPYHGSLNAEACAQVGSSVQLPVQRRQDRAPGHVAYCNDKPHRHVAAANTPAHAHPPVPASWDNEAQQRQAPGWSSRH